MSVLRQRSEKDLWRRGEGDRNVFPRARFIPGLFTLCERPQTSITDALLFYFLKNLDRKGCRSLAISGKCDYRPKHQLENQNEFVRERRQGGGRV